MDQEVKDAIIGGASNYTWDDIKYWVNSIKATGFKGDIVVVASNVDIEFVDKLSSLGVIVSLYGNQNGDRYETKSSLAPHVERFFWLWNHLRSVGENYRYVTVTDTRDVIFQKDPTAFLEEICMHKPIVTSSEGLLYKDEPWGHNNFGEAFGPFFQKVFEEAEICNVGVIGGEMAYVRDMLLMIFQMSLNRPITIVDQAAYNFLLNTQPYLSENVMATVDDKWAVQLGTTKAALDAGSGDIGKDEEAKLKYEKAFLGSQPIINGAEVTNAEGVAYAIVHQWDRIPTLAAEVVKHYGS